MRTTTLLAAALAAATLLPLAPVSAQAAPGGLVAATTLLPLAEGAPEVTLVRGGCGIGFHRGFYGVCRPNRFFGYRRFGYRHFGWHRSWHRWY